MRAPRHIVSVARTLALGLLSCVACESLAGVDFGAAHSAEGSDASIDDASDASVDSSTNADSSLPMDAPSLDTSFEASADTGQDSSSVGDDASSDSGAPVVSLADCVLLLHMDEPSWAAAGSVADSSGQGNNGNPVGTANTTITGKFGRAGLFDGSGWVDIPASASLDGPLTQLTYAAWIYPKDLPDASSNWPSPGIFSKREAYAQNVAYTLFLWTDNQAYFDLQGHRDNSTAVFANGGWSHVAVVYNGAGPTATLYVNGVLNVTQAADSMLTTNVQDLLIANLPGGGNTFVGLIDEVAVWSRALSATEIAALYQADREL